MDDRFYEDLEFTRLSLSKTSIDVYNEDEEESEEEYEDEEVNDGGSEVKSEELACPFCCEDFDVLGLCCHIDSDHRVDVKTGICPVCAVKVRINMASHVITQHGNILKALCNKKHQSTRSRSALFLLRKDMQEKHLRCIRESASVDSSPGAVAAADSVLLSFVNSPSNGYRAQTKEATSFTEASSSVETSEDDYMERIETNVGADQNKEKARRSEYVQGLVLSAMFEDLL